MQDSVLTARSAQLTSPPVLELVRHRAMDLLLSGAQLHGELTQLVEVDAALTGLVLRLVGSKVYERAEEDDVDIPDALERVGSVALTYAVKHLPPLPERLYRASVEQACRDWVHALAVAAAARWLASSGSYEQLGEAFVAGLLHDIGRRCGADPTQHGTRTSAVLGRWRLSPRIVHAARFHEQVRDGLRSASIAIDGVPLDARTCELLDVVAHADTLATALGFSDGFHFEDSLDYDTDAASAAEAIRLELAHAGALLGLESGSLEDFVRHLTNEEMRLGEAEPPHDERDPEVERMARAHGNIVAARARAQVLEILESGLREIREGLGCDRVLLMERTSPDELRIRGRCASDPSDLAFAGGFHGIVLDVDPGGELRRVIEGKLPSAACSHRDSSVLAQLGVPSFACAPLSAGSSSMGVVLADRFFSESDVAVEDARRLRMLCDSLGLVLENVVLDLQGEKLRSLAEKDELTGINNRRNIVRILHAEIERARRFGKPLSLALLDVDHFKRWNDVHGHQVGDMVLQAVSQLVTSCSREVDHFGRYGGEEFLVILPETSVQHATLYAERLRVSLENQCREMLSDFPDMSLTVSIGVATLGEVDDLDAMVRRADCALYEAKRHGRNRVCIGEPQV